MSITINGVSVGGSSVRIDNDGKVFVDGKDVTHLVENFTIRIEGNVKDLQVVACKELSVSGNAGSINSTTGNVKVAGKVDGSVKSMSGDIECADVGDKVETMSGDVTCGNVAGKVKTMSGDINHRR